MSEVSGHVHTSVHFEPLLALENPTQMFPAFVFLVFGHSLYLNLKSTNHFLFRVITYFKIFFSKHANGRFY
jgi:hypothetical protein